MQRFPGPTKLIGVQVGEIRVREIGQFPATSAKFALMTSTGQSAGLYVQHSFSDRTQQLLRMLCESMELDAVEALGQSDTPNTSLEGEGWEADEDPDGMDFG